MTTIHLGDCLNGCDTCSKNHHSEVVNSVCPTCGDYIEGKLDNTAECNLCGHHIEDINTAGFVLPWGDTCSDCLTAIYDNKEGK